MPLARRLICGLTALSVALAVGTPSALASQTATSGKFSCTVKSLAPVLRSGQITGSLQIDCNVAASLIIEFGVVEMDGTTEDRVEVPFQKRTLFVPVGRSTIVNTVTTSCVSTETGNEELATRSRITLSGTVSLWDRTTPPIDSYAC